jgi:hypothetical protein
MIGDIRESRPDPEAHRLLLEVTLIGMLCAVDAMGDKLVEVTRNARRDRMLLRTVANAFAQESIGMIGNDGFARLMEDVCARTASGEENDLLKVMEVDPEGEVDEIIAKMKEAAK